MGKGNLAQCATKIQKVKDEKSKQPNNKREKISRKL